MMILRHPLFFCPNFKVAIREMLKYDETINMGREDKYGDNH